jgi:hypothetical protein
MIKTYGKSKAFPLDSYKDENKKRFFLDKKEEGKSLLYKWINYKFKKSEISQPEYLSFDKLTYKDFIDLFDNEFNYGLYICDQDVKRILYKKNNGSWIIRRCDIKSPLYGELFTVVYKYFGLYYFNFINIPDKGIFELNRKYYDPRKEISLSENINEIKLGELHFRNILDLCEYFGITFGFRVFANALRIKK